jgi:hypothetical protein
VPNELAALFTQVSPTLFAVVAATVRLLGAGIPDAGLSACVVDVATLEYPESPAEFVA